jgi:hypothetical protein
MTHSQTDIPGPDIPAPPMPEPSPPPIEDPPIGDPPPDGPEVPIDDPRPVLDAASERDLGGPEDTIAGPGDGTEGPDAPDEPGPRPPGFPDPAGGDDDAPEQQR